MHDEHKNSKSPGPRVGGLGHNGGPPLRDGNWIAVSRELIEHHIVGAGQVVTPADKNKGAFSRLESWLDLLCMANYRERKVTVHGATIILQPGQTIAGRAFLAKRWNWSEKTVRVWLSRLEAELMITLACEELKQGQTKGHLPNVLSVCNWGKFQPSSVDQGPDLGRPQGHPRATQGPHLNKETNKQLNTECAREGEEHVGFGVFVNCETVRHKDFTIPLKAIDMQLIGTVPMDEIKAASVGNALQWAADIEGGKSPRTVVPSSPANFIRASIQHQKAHAAVTDVRKTRAATKHAPRADGKSFSELNDEVLAELERGRRK